MPVHYLWAYCSWATTRALRSTAAPLSLPTSVPPARTHDHSPSVRPVSTTLTPGPACRRSSRTTLLPTSPAVSLPSSDPAATFTHPSISAHDRARNTTPVTRALRCSHLGRAPHLPERGTLSAGEAATAIELAGVAFISPTGVGRCSRERARTMVHVAVMSRLPPSISSARQPSARHRFPSHLPPVSLPHKRTEHASEREASQSRFVSCRQPRQRDAARGVQVPAPCQESPSPYAYLPPHASVHGNVECPAPRDALYAIHARLHADSTRPKNSVFSFRAVSILRSTPHPLSLPQFA
ncbi:hypothetical protein V8D89_002151 [Ganoderma adspersum]